MGLASPLSIDDLMDRGYLREYITKLCEIVLGKEPLATIGTKQVLRKYGVIDGDGKVNKAKIPTRDTITKYTKQKGILRPK